MSPACNPLPPHRKRRAALARTRSPVSHVRALASIGKYLIEPAKKFLDKWKSENDFSAYFENEWLILNRFWYLGASPGTPATNNALESFNKTIKDGGTLRERHHLARFLVIASDIVKDWSNEYITNTERRFAKLPTVSLKTWTESYQWAKLSKQVPLKNRAELVCSYRIPAGLDLECKNFEKPWETFDEYKEQHFREWEVIMPREKENWLQGTCNCPKFLKDYICRTRIVPHESQIVSRSLISVSIEKCRLRHVQSQCNPRLHNLKGLTYGSGGFRLGRNDKLPAFVSKCSIFCQGYLSEYMYYTSLSVDPTRTLFVHVPDNNIYPPDVTARGLERIVDTCLEQLDQDITEKLNSTKLND
ncbi:hypothetical protein EVAR_13889_1 [Eumeta japonica]|uniref:Uncharacterized protein n=1 Tax=Eumeta variegata TaxID=151549 RepID=A0A4C1U8G7_EUMVA|nr:hypothetical protein EVAR_13889_1 [Eumeta japonica]